MGQVWPGSVRALTIDGSSATAHGINYLIPTYVMKHSNVIVILVLYTFYFPTTNFINIDSDKYLIIFCSSFVLVATLWGKLCIFFHCYEFNLCNVCATIIIDLIYDCNLCRSPGVHYQYLSLSWHFSLFRILFALIPYTQTQLLTFLVFPNWLSRPKFPKTWPKTGM